MGYTVWLAPAFDNGKGLHLRGFLSRFEAVARKNLAFLSQISELEVPIIGIDPAITLTYRDEYTKVSNSSADRVPIALIQEWLATQLGTFHIPKSGVGTFDYVLFGHCTEKAIAAASQNQWVAIFAAFGLSLRVESTGCCGMSGVYGHEAEHVADSKKMFDTGWKNCLAKIDNPSTQVLVTGYSCRSQLKRFHSGSFLHPIQGLLSHLRRNQIAAEDSDTAS